VTSSWSIFIQQFHYVSNTTTVLYLDQATCFGC